MLQTRAVSDSLPPPREYQPQGTHLVQFVSSEHSEEGDPDYGPAYMGDVVCLVLGGSRRPTLLLHGRRGRSPYRRSVM